MLVTRLALAPVVCLVFIGLAHAGADGSALPGGVADAEGKVGYLSQPKGGIVAISLEKGDVLWESKDASRPLTLVGKRLAALAPEKGKGNVLRVVVFDTEAMGKKPLESEPIVLPDWAVVGAGLDRHEMGKGFTARASAGIFLGGSRSFWIQALDLNTKALLWERAYEEQRLIPPPP
jgi:hypothetical protein